MKQLKLLLLLNCFALFASAQISQIKIVSFQVKNVLPAKIDDWNTVPAALLLTAQKVPTVQLREPKLVLQIRSNGAIICGNNASNAIPMGSFDVKTFTTAELTGLLGNCTTLKEGNYQLCVQFFNLDRIAISNEICKDFRVEVPKAEDYAAPTLINPENGQFIAKKDILKPISFRWTPLVPKSEAALPTRPQPVRPVPASIQPERAVSEGVVKLETRKVTEARDEYESPVVLYGDELLTVPRSQE